MIDPGPKTFQKNEKMHLLGVRCPVSGTGRRWPHCLAGLPMEGSRRTSGVSGQKGPSLTLVGKRDLLQRAGACLCTPDRVRVGRREETTLSLDLKRNELMADFPTRQE